VEGDRRRLHCPSGPAVRLHRAGRLIMRTVFVSCLVVIFGGLAYCLVIGLLQR
jgi:hypothetical protein